MKRRFFDRARAGRGEQDAPAKGILSASETHFIAMQDHFLLTMVLETGWPSVQHRGGPPGFVQPVGEDAIGWADFRWNRSSHGSGAPPMERRVALIFIDYPEQRRLKLLGRLRSYAVRDRPDLALRLALDDGRVPIEFVATVTVDAADWSCRQPNNAGSTLPEIEMMAARPTPTLQAGSVPSC